MVIQGEELSLEDVQVVAQDFVVAQGYTNPFNFGRKAGNSFGRFSYLPVFYVWKVHKESPLVLSASQYGDSIRVYPQKDLETPTRMPVKIWEDRIAWDITAFLLLPFEAKFEEGQRIKSVRTIDDCFTPKKGSAKHLKGSIAYVERGVSLHTQDMLSGGAVMPSQLKYFLHNWLRLGHNLYVSPRTRKSSTDPKYIGELKLSRGQARQTALELTGQLEKRYDTNLFLK